MIISIILIRLMENLKLSSIAKAICLPSYTDSTTTDFLLIQIMMNANWK